MLKVALQKEQHSFAIFVINCISSLCSLYFTLLKHVIYLYAILINRNVVCLCVSVYLLLK